MAYNDISEFPRTTIVLDALNATPRALATGGGLRVSGILMANQTANVATVFVRETDDSPVAFEYAVPASLSVFVPVRVFWQDVEILATGTSIDINVFIYAGDPAGTGAELTVA